MEDNIFDKIHDVDLKKTMEESYIDYAMSVIAARALPDVRLKVFYEFATAVQLFLLLLRKKTDSVFLNLSCETKTSSKIPTLSLKVS